MTSNETIQPEPKAKMPSPSTLFVAQNCSNCEALDVCRNDTIAQTRCLEMQKLCLQKDILSEFRALRQDLSRIVDVLKLKQHSAPAATPAAVTVQRSMHPAAGVKFRRGLPEKGIRGFDAEPYPFKREDGLRELGARFIKAGDGRPRIFVSSHYINLISELLEYKVEVKERDHAIDAVRYGLPLKSAAPLHAFRFG